MVAIAFFASRMQPSSPSSPPPDGPPPPREDEEDARPLWCRVVCGAFRAHVEEDGAVAKAILRACHRASTEGGGGGHEKK